MLMLIHIWSLFKIFMSAEDETETEISFVDPSQETTESKKLTMRSHSAKKGFQFNLIQGRKLIANSRFCKCIFLSWHVIILITWKVHKHIVVVFCINIKCLAGPYNHMFHRRAFYLLTHPLICVQKEKHFFKENKRLKDVSKEKQEEASPFVWTEFVTLQNYENENPFGKCFERFRSRRYF